MRGKDSIADRRELIERITPAYAGKSGDTEERYFAIGDHPRLCGEKYNNIWKEVIYLGSPPPMRGKVEEKPVKIEKTGIAPAYAGKSQCRIKSAGVKSGSPPPMRGKAKALQRHLIPHRITPAYAGKRRFEQNRKHRREDHPRLCGEKVYAVCLADLLVGSPPPMRGKVKAYICMWTLQGITPAYAGKSNISCLWFASTWDHPRLCGEKSDRSATCFFKSGSPPPMRGKVSQSRQRKADSGITPAYAGKSFILSTGGLFS